MSKHPPPPVLVFVECREKPSSNSESHDLFSLLILMSEASRDSSLSFSRSIVKNWNLFQLVRVLSRMEINLDLGNASSASPSAETEDDFQKMKLHLSLLPRRRAGTGSGCVSFCGRFPNMVSAAGSWCGERLLLAVETESPRRRAM